MVPTITATTPVLAATREMVSGSPIDMDLKIPECT
jgi:hypothetical protein